jgi:F-type H+-transporting ATPase subunit b
VDINATLFGQAITFGIFIWFTMKFVWPPIMQAINEREKTIADGLAAAKKGEESLEEAQKVIHAEMAQARMKMSEIIEHANKRGEVIIKEAQEKAVLEGQRLYEAAQARIQQEMDEARMSLRGEVINIAMASAEKLMQRSLDTNAHRDLLGKVVGEL